MGVTRSVSFPVSGKLTRSPALGLFGLGLSKAGIDLKLSINELSKLDPTITELEPDVRTVDTLASINRKSTFVAGL